MTTHSRIAAPVAAQVDRNEAANAVTYFKRCLAEEQDRLAKAATGPEQIWAAERIARYSRIVGVSA